MCLSLHVNVCSLVLVFLVLSCAYKFIINISIFGYSLLYLLAVLIILLLNSLCKLSEFFIGGGHVTVDLRLIFTNGILATPVSWYLFAKK